MKTRKYGLITTIAMVVGIVIGSGIFFKTDDILVKTNGNVFFGAIAFVIGALGMIFGSLTIAKIATKDDTAGGIITYSEMAYNKKFGYYVGILQIFLYYPCLAAIISWVAGIYTGILFGFEINSLTHWVVAGGYLVILFIINLITEKLGGNFQNISTFIKLIPLIIIAILGLIFGDTSNITNSITTSNIITSTSALVAVAFAFDGWIVATSICHEVKNAKKNIPLALTIGSLLVLSIYLLYYLGISATVGADKIIELGDAHVKEAADILLGGNAYKYISICIVISVLGTVNGLILGLIRLPYSMGIRKELPKSDILGKLNSKTNMPVNSGIFAFTEVLFWFFVHFLTTKIPAIATFDISALPIIMNYVIYIALYVYVIKKSENKKDIIIPSLAIIGALLVVITGFMDENIILYLAVTMIVLLIGKSIKRKGEKKAN